MSEREAQADLKRRLARFRFQLKANIFVEKTSIYIAFFLVFMAALPVMYFVGQADSVFRWLISIAAFAALVAGASYFIGLPLYRMTFGRETPDLAKTALEIGDRLPGLKDRLSNAFQLVESNPGQTGSSTELAWSAFAGAFENVRELKFASLIETGVLRRNLVTFAGAATLFLTAYALFPARYAAAFALLLDPGDSQLASTLRLDVSPGHAEVIYGETLHVNVGIYGDRADAGALLLRDDSGNLPSRQTLRKVREGYFTHEIADVRKRFQYAAEAYGLRTEWFDVHVVHPPELTELQLTLNHPGYTNLGSQKLDPGIGSVTALRGTEVIIEAVTNKPVSAARVAFATGDTLELGTAETGLNGSFIVDKPTSYSLHLTDSRGLQNHSVIQYPIDVMADQRPAVDVVFPGKDIDLDESLEVPLAIRGEDDFGFSRLYLEFEVKSSLSAAKPARIRVPFRATEGKLQATYAWDLAPLMLVPNDVVEYRAVLLDNDTVTGPKRAESAVYRLRFPSMAEIFAETTASQQDAVETAESAFEDARNIGENIRKLREDLLRDKNLDWEKKQQLKETLEQEKAVAEKLEKVADNLDKMLEKLDRHDLLSEETLQKYEELQDLLEEVATPELKKMLEELQNSLQDLDPKKLQKSLEAFQESEDAFQNSLEKTINLLKQLQAEQKLDEAVKTAEEMVETQQEINKALPEDSLAQNDTSRLAEKQAQQKNNLDALRKALQDLQSQMSESPQVKMPREQISEAQEQASSSRMSESMQKMQQQLQNSQTKQAGETGQQLEQQMQSLRDKLSKAQEQMQQDQKSEVMQALQRGTRNILQLSRRQEQVNQATAGQRRGKGAYRDLADQQQNLRSGMERTTNQLFDLSKQSFFVPPEIGREMAEALNKMQSAIKNLQGDRGRQAAVDQNNAMQGLNRAASALRLAMQGLGQSGQSGSGIEQLMQQLSGMAGEQQSINQGSQKLGGQGALSPEQQAALSRLASRQSALRKTMQQLAEEAAGKREVLGSLDKIAQDMEDVAKELARRNVNGETLDRQKRILSRLLDAQKSVQRREYSRKRKAETGSDYAAADPGSLPADLGNKENRLYQDMLRALRENYARDYKILIQKYFEALEKDTGHSDR